jgi:V8-like Glu-specific endopeptidase
MANSEEGHDVTNEKEYRFSIDQMGLTKDHQCITSINSDRREILHKISTEPGHSGAPIILEQEQHTLSIIGVHKGGVKDQGLNAGGLITAELIDLLKR